MVTILAKETGRLLPENEQNIGYMSSKKKSHFFFQYFSSYEYDNGNFGIQTE